jgi:hypothetical protein
MEEVIKAFRKIQQESGQAGKAGAAGLNSLAAAGKNLVPQLTAVGLAIGAVTFAVDAALAAVRLAANSVAEFGKLVAAAIETADAMGKLSQKTGLAAETLVTFSFAAKTADVQQELLNSSLIKFQRVMGDYTAGAEGARDATAQLFGSRKALEGLSEDQRLQKVVRALAEMERSSRRTTLAVEFFGKSGAELLPLIEDLGGPDGFEKARREVERFGLNIDDKATAAAQRANDAMTKMRLIVDGLANRFQVGLTPALAVTGEVLVETFAGAGTDAFETLGKIAGDVLLSIVKNVGALALALENLTGLFSKLSALGKVLDDPSKLAVATGLEAKNALDFIRAPGSKIAEEIARRATGKGSTLPGEIFGKAFSEELGKAEAEVTATFATFFLKIAEAEEKLRKGLQPHKKKRPGDPDPGFFDEKAAKRAGDARLKLEESLLDNELAFIQARLKLRTEEERDAFEDGLRSIRVFFAERRRLLEEANDAEIASLRKREALIANSPADDPAAQLEKEKQIADIRTKIAIREIELQGDLTKLKREERKAIDDAADKARQGVEEREKEVQRLAEAFEDAVRERDEKQKSAAEARRKSETEILELEGNRHEAALRAIDDEAAALRKSLEDGVTAQEQIDADVERLRQARLKKLAADEEKALRGQLFEEAAQRAAEAFDDLERRRQAIQERVESGTLFQFQADEQILALERERLSTLQEIADAAVRAANATGDPDNVARARELSDAVRELGIHVDTAGRRAAEFKASIEGIAESALADFFTTGIDGAESFADAFRSMASSIISDLRRMAAQAAATAITRKLLGGALGALLAPGPGGVNPLGGGGASEWNERFDCRAVERRRVRRQRARGLTSGNSGAPRAAQPTGHASRAAAAISLCRWRSRRRRARGRGRRRAKHDGDRTR